MILIPNRKLIKMSFQLLTTKTKSRLMILPVLFFFLSNFAQCTSLKRDREKNVLIDDTACLPAACSCTCKHSTGWRSEMLGLLSFSEMRHWNCFGRGLTWDRFKKPNCSTNDYTFAVFCWSHKVWWIFIFGEFYLNLTQLLIFTNPDVNV